MSASPAILSLADLRRVEFQEFRNWQIRAETTGAVIQQFGEAWAMVTANDSSNSLNRVWFPALETMQNLDAIEALFAAHGRIPQFDILPGTPHLEALTRYLHEHGYYQRDFKSVMAGYDLDAGGVDDVPYLIQDATHYAAEAAELYALAFELDRTHNAARYEGFLRSFQQEHPSLWRYGIVQRGRLAAVAILLLEHEVAYLATAATHPDFRRRGYQLTLMQARIATAQKHGCRLFSAQTGAYSDSQRNMQRIGLQIAATKSRWIKYTHELEQP